MAYFYLLAAIFCEVLGTMLLPISNNFEVFIAKNKFKIEKVTESPISDLHELEKLAIYKLHNEI